MEKIWICLVLLSVGTVAFAEDLYDYDSGNFEDYIYDEEWGESNLQDNPNENPDKEDVLRDDKNAEENIEHFYPDYDKAVDTDYQIEDNRSAPKEDENENLPNAAADQSQRDEITKPRLNSIDEVEFKSEEEEEDQDTAVLTDEAESDKEEIEEKIADALPNLEEHEDAKTISFVKEDDTSVPDNPQSEELSFDINSDIKPLPLPPKISDEEMQKIIGEIVSQNEENDANKNSNDNTYIEETKNILEDLDNESKENNGFVQEAKKDTMQWNNFNDAIAEDTVDKVYEDLNSDLDKLMSTWKKLSVGEIPEEKNADDSINPDNVQEYENKYNRPFREENVLSLRDDYYEDVANHDDELNKESADASEQNDKHADDLKRQETDGNAAELNIEDLTEEDGDDIIPTIIGKEDKEANQNSLQEDTDKEDDEEEDNDSFVENAEDNIFKDKFADIKVNEGSTQNIIPKEDVDVVQSENNSADVFNADDLADNIEAEEQSVDDNDRVPNDEPILYLKDSILPNEDDQSYQKDETKSQSEKQVTRAIDVSELNPAQYNQLMEQFKKLHEDELDVHSESFGKNVAVNRVTLSLDEPVVVQSFNYPQQYPTDNITDWIFEGDGVGIELNITDFSVNGFFGDYLLVKPGGVDEAGHDGLIFSYRLNEPRRYRFLDVNRMFVRFEARPGNAFFTGFQFSVKMVAPLPEVQEILPEPEAVMPDPKETLTLVLGGMDTIHFSRIQEQFRLLVADMATLYINANDIDPGSNTTYETTQITNIAVCNINWPDFENCAQVTFAVPVVYDDDEGNYDPRLSTGELSSMWQMYSSQDPFAARLRRMGLTEFTSPNDSSVMMVWLVISVGVLMCMSMLAFALWRYSCVDSYTRMPEFNSQDGGYNEKKGLDLYPTPHQTLPPLYESDYKWADVKYQESNSVDMGGFANRSFTRDELYDIESDEDVISTRDRKLEFAAPNDASKV